MNDLPVISNASPLIALAQIDHLDLMKQLFQTIVIEKTKGREGLFPHDLFRIKKTLLFFGDPEGSRTPVSRVRVWCPRPLNDGVTHNMMATT